MLKISLVLSLVAATASGLCDSGWSPFGQFCYILFTSSQSFDAHRATCVNLGGWLVSINSAAENNFVNQLQQAGCSSGTCPTYIGLARNDAGQFTYWMDGTPFGGSAYYNWITDEPNNLGDVEDCVELTKDSGKWNDIPCGNNQLAMCERPQSTCDSGWSSFRQSCYLFSPEAQQFDAHRSRCESLGGWLVSINSAEENDFVNQLQQAGCSSGTCLTYIGLAKNTAGQFTNWLDGTPFGGSAFSYWNIDEPNNAGGGEGCVELIKDTGKWNDISCGNNRLSMCEKAQSACDIDLQQAGCSSGTCDAFIGLERIEGSFSYWKDGTPFGGTAYSNWNTNEPNNVNDDESCGETIRGTGKWNDISCENNRLAVCEKPPICGEGWTQFGECCYTLRTFAKSFDHHRSDCQSIGGELVSISSSVENDFVDALLRSIVPAYIGLLRDGAAQFASWLDGTPFGGSAFSNWNPDEPNNFDNKEGCAEMDHDTGKWNDISCDNRRIAVCENCPSLPKTTTTPTISTASTTTTTPTATASTIKSTTSTSTTVGNFDCRTVRTNVNCSAPNGPASCDAQCRLFKYGRGICYSFGTTTCPGYPPGSKGCLCYGALDCRTLRTQVNCAAANAATSCTSWCKLFQWTRGVCTTFQSSWTCPGYAAGQKACLCQ